MKLRVHPMSEKRLHRLIAKLDMEPAEGFPRDGGDDGGGSVREPRRPFPPRSGDQMALEQD